MPKNAPEEKIRIGISSCLLGEEVRFDGGHKRDDYVLNTLSHFFKWVPVCPEVEIGLGTPRETLRLVGDVSAPRMVTTKTNIDHTDKMAAFAQAKSQALAGMNIHGYILKKDSPSCGMERVRVYGDGNMPARNGTGLFAQALKDKLPYLPLEEEGRLNDFRLRENFIVRVFCHYRWGQLMANCPRAGDLVDFHTRHKLLIMAHSEKHMRELGKLVGQSGQTNFEALLQKYAELFFAALSFKSTNKKHANVLQHIAGHFKKHIDSRDKAELKQNIDDYRLGLVPLIVPLTLLKHYTNKFDISYIREQIYLNPHPKELMLLNHV